MKFYQIKKNGIYDEFTYALTYNQTKNFKADFVELLTHDKQSFDTPADWQNKDIVQSPLVTGFSALWNELLDKDTVLFSPPITFELFACITESFPVVTIPALMFWMKFLSVIATGIIVLP